MNRIDNIIADLAYIHDSLRALREIQTVGNCNTCAGRSECEYCPRPGQLVRYNCPFYKEEEN